MNESKQEFVDLCWKELLNQCASDPDKAIRLVMVTKDDVNKAMTKVFNIIQQNKQYSEWLVKDIDITTNEGTIES